MPKATSPASSPTLIEIKTRVQESVYDAYAERAVKHGRTTEDEMALRLRECRYFTSTQPIYIDDNARQTLSRLAGRTLTTDTDLTSWAHSLAQLNVHGVTITLDEQLITRLQSRADAMGRTLREHIHTEVIEALEREVGLR